MHDEHLFTDCVNREVPGWIVVLLLDSFHHINWKKTPEITYLSPVKKQITSESMW